MGKKNDEKTVCKYGAKCYRKNPQHLRDFGHPEEERDEESSPPAKKKKTIDDFFGTKKEKKSEMDDKNGGDDKDAEASTSKDDSVAEEESRPETPETEPDQGSEEEESEGPPSPKDVKENIKHKFLVEMPDDFYHFWDFAKTINEKNPQDAFKTSLGLQLVGPFDVLAGRTRSKSGQKVNWLRHWRYYYDPPEFLTVIRGDDSNLFHFGYYRDDPSELPVFVGTNAAKDNCNIRPRGENLFAAISWFIDDSIKKDKTKKDSLTKLKAKVKEFAEGKKYPLESKTAKMKARDKKIVTPSFHAAGIVVPVDANEVGYRELPETDADLKKMFKRIEDAKTEKDRDEAFDPLMEVIMLVQFANDECDYGEGLELGIDMFSSGHKALHGQIMNLLPLAYQLLRRDPFGKIITAHLKDRKLTADLSQLQ